jgi:hypothetical protein
VSVRPLERSEENVRGGYVWKGELRIWDNQILMGWYTATEGNSRLQGSRTHPAGRAAGGDAISDHASDADAHAERRYASLPGLIPTDRASTLAALARRWPGRMVTLGGGSRQRWEERQVD